jgi:hypothetical protein
LSLFFDKTNLFSTHYFVFNNTLVLANISSYFIKYFCCIYKIGLMSQRMKRFLPIVMLLMTGALVAPSAKADITSRMTSSVQLTVNSAATQMNRIGSSFSISGNNVDTTDGTTANTISAGTISSGVYAPGTIAAVQDDPGESFSFTQAYTQADAIDTTGPDIGDVSAYGDQLSTAAGTAGSLAGTVTSQGALTVTAGGAGTSATGQFVTELQIN